MPLVTFFSTLLTLNFSHRLLQISSFNGKMNALNEVNKVISSVSYYTHRHGNPEEEEWLTAERMAVSAYFQWSSLHGFGFSFVLNCSSSSVLWTKHTLLIFIYSVRNMRSHVMVIKHFNSSLSVKKCCISVKAAVENCFSVLLKSRLRNGSLDSVCFI